MKNLPEHEAFKALENRLNNYTEQPDDDLWKKIVASLPPRNPVWAPWMNYLGAALMVAALGWALWHAPLPQAGQGERIAAQPKSKTAEATATGNATMQQASPAMSSPQAALSPATQPEIATKAKDAEEQRWHSNSGSGSVSSKPTFPKPGSDSRLNPDAKFDSRLDPDTKSDSRLDPDTKSDSRLNPDTKPDSKLDPDTKSGSRLDPHTKFYPNSISGAKAGSHAGSPSDANLKPNEGLTLSSTAGANSPALFSQRSTSNPGSVSTLNRNNKSTQQPIAKESDRVADPSNPPYAPKQESTLLEPSSQPNEQTTVQGAGILAVSPPLSTQDGFTKQAVYDSLSGAEPVTTVDKVESASGPASLEQKTPYDRQKKKRNSLSLYALFSPTLSFQTATPSARDGMIIQKFKSPSIFSGNRLGLALEAGVQGRLSKKFEYFAGLSVYHQSQTMQYTYQSPGDVIFENGADGLSYTVKPATTEQSISYNMLNLGAQAGVLYTLKEHRLSHKIGLALQYQKGLTRASTGEPYDNASSSYLNYQVLYRAEIALDDRLTFIVQPSVTRTWLVNETLHTPFTLKQYRPGVSIGLSYRFRR
jgi:hypothetical protein